MFFREIYVLKNLTMCNCRGSVRSYSSDIKFLLWHSASVTCGDIEAIKSCTSASTGGGEGCLMISVETGISTVSKEIMEQGSSAGCISISSVGKVIDSKLDFSGATLLLSVFVVIPLSTSC